MKLQKPPYNTSIEAIKPYIKNKKVLDVGCVGGDYRLKKGRFTLLHEEMAKEAKEIIGVDLNKKALELMKKKNPNLNLICCNAYDIPFDASSFDVVVAGALIEHLDNAGVFLDKVNLILKKDGIFIGTVPNAYNLAGIIRLLFGSQPTPSRNSTHVHIFDNWTISLLLLQHNFEPELFFVNSRNMLLKPMCRVYPMFSPQLGFVAKKISVTKAKFLLQKFFDSLSS